MANLQKPSIHFYIGLIAIILGFVCLRTPPVDGVWTLTVASVLLVLGYIILIPAGLWQRAGDNLPLSEQPLKTRVHTTTNIVGLMVFLCTLIVYMLTAWPGPGWWDSSNYIACCFTLGVDGPPGSILLQLWGRLFSFFSLITSPAVRINTLIAIISALSATVVYFTTVRLLGSISREKESSTPAAVIAAVLAALTLAFSQSVWCKATFTNPYALSLLAGSLIIYLAVRWWENPDTAGAGNFLLLAAFLFGIDISVHRSNLLLVPAFFLLVIVRRPRALLDLKLWIAGILLFVLGLSMQMAIMFRAQLDPLINLGNPDTWKGLWSYFTLSQFGIATFGSDLLTRKGPFWDYQVNEMYLRYFGWNFIGLDSKGMGIKWTGLWGLPVVVGIIGLVYHFLRRYRQALFFFAVFLLASLGAIFYLNVPANFFREMDRHFLVSFMLFTIWIGIGSYTLLRLPQSLFTGRPCWVSNGTRIVALILILALPLNLFLANWDNNNMSDNYTSYAFGHNLLETCEPNAILITRGDSDTFLAWYFQIVEQIRPDMTVLNIGLLNAKWYRHTVISYHPDIPWSFEEDSLENLQPIPWETDSIFLPGVTADADSVTIVVPPTYGGKYLLIQDQVLLNILRQNRWQRPIYFSAGFGEDLPLGLIDICRLDGFAWRVVPKAEERADYNMIEDNLLHQYDYRGLGQQTFLDPTGKDMTSMYQAAFARLAESYQNDGEQQKLEHLQTKFDSLWPNTDGLETMMEGE